MLQLQVQESGHWHQSVPRYPLASVLVSSCRDMKKHTKYHNPYNIPQVPLWIYPHHIEREL